MVEVISKEKNITKFIIEVNQEEFKNAIKEAYNENKGSFQIPGFRKGKVPLKIIEANYGKEVFYEDAANIALNKKYPQALKELELNPIDYPKVDIKDLSENGFKAELTVTEAPKATFEDYKNLTIKYPKVEYKEEMLEEAINSEKEKNSRLVEKDSEIKEGDTVNLDYEGFVDEKAFEGGKAEGYDLVIGSKHFVPGFEEGLIGAKKGDDLDVEVTFHEDYHEHLAGKKAIFKCHINSVKEKEYPEIDDDFAMDVSEFDTLDEYKKDLEEKIRKNLDAKERELKIDGVIKALANMTDVEIPEIMIENQIDSDINDFAQRITQMGVSFDDYLKHSGTQKENMRNDFREGSKQRVLEEIVLSSYIDNENIEADEEDIKKELKELAKIYKSDDEEKFVKDFLEKEDTSQIKSFATNKKAFDHMINNFKFEEVDPSKQAKEENKEEEREETEE